MILEKELRRWFRVRTTERRIRDVLNQRSRNAHALLGVARRRVGRVVVVIEDVDARARRIGGRRIDWEAASVSEHERARTNRERCEGMSGATFGSCVGLSPTMAFLPRTSTTCSKEFDRRGPSVRPSTGTEASHWVHHDAPDKVAALLIEHFAPD